MSSNQEDYLETIYRIQLSNAGVRVTRIARELQVSKPSVTSALRVLKRDGLIDYEPYGDIILTEEGKKRAKAIYGRHTHLTTFFSKVLGIDPEAAERQACVIEHGLTEEAYERIVSLTEFLEAHPKRLSDWLVH